MGFDAVVYVLLQPSVHLSANSHYTSITRARKRPCLLGGLDAFGNTQMRAKDVRRTLPATLLRAMAAPPKPLRDTPAHLGLRSQKQNVT